MNYAGKFVVTALALTASVLCAESAQAGTLFSNGFETDVNGWLTPTRVASGTGGVTSADGSFHARAGTDFTRWGGYNCGAGDAVPTAFQEYWTTVDIYLDVDGGWADNTRFDFASAINGAGGTHRRDFIFNAGFYGDTDMTGPGAGTDRFVISASNNSQPGSAFAKNPARSPISIGTTGWYTFEHHFYDNAGTLAVDMRILDASDTLVNSWTLSDVTDLIGLVGGNRYGWFDYNQFGALAIDNTALRTADLVPLPGAAWSGLALLGAIGGTTLIRRRRARASLA